MTTSRCRVSLGSRCGERPSVFRRTVGQFPVQVSRLWRHYIDAQLKCAPVPRRGRKNDLAQRAPEDAELRAFATSRFARREVERSTNTSGGARCAVCICGSLHLPRGRPEAGRGERTPTWHPLRPPRSPREIRPPLASSLHATSSDAPQCVDRLNAEGAARGEVGGGAHDGAQKAHDCSKRQRIQGSNTEQKRFECL